MIHIYSNSDKIAYGVKRYIADFISDIAQLPSNDTPGSEAFVIEDSSTYVLNGQKQWIRSIN
mgnify:CR=1 FL=1